MSVIRVHKNKNFTVMSNTHLRDKNLSLKSKGLLSVMLSLPDDWDYSIAGLCSICKENETAVKSEINELKANRYVIVIREEPTKENGGRIKYNYEVYEEPQGEKQDSEKQGIEILGVEFQGVENQGQINTNISNTDKLNTDNKNYALFFDKNKGRVHACFGAKQGANLSYSDKQLEERLTGAISEYAYDVENANVIFDIFMYFYKEYELRLGRKHTILSDKTYEKIIKSYYEPAGDEISNTDIDIIEHRKMVDLYFDTDYNKRGNYGGEVDKSLQHFFSGQIRNHLLMRVRDCEDYV